MSIITYKSLCLFILSYVEWFNVNKGLFEIIWDNWNSTNALEFSLGVKDSSCKWNGSAFWKGWSSQLNNLYPKSFFSKLFAHS